MKPTVIADHWEGLLVVSNIYGFVLAFLCLVKGVSHERLHRSVIQRRLQI